MAIITRKKSFFGSAKSDSSSGGNSTNNFEFQETSPRESGFAEFLKCKLLPEVQAFKWQRKTQVKQFEVFRMLGILAAIALIKAFFYFGEVRSELLTNSIANIVILILGIIVCFIPSIRFAVKSRKKDPINIFKEVADFLGLKKTIYECDTLHQERSRICEIYNSSLILDKCNTPEDCSMSISTIYNDVVIKIGDFPEMDEICESDAMVFLLQFDKKFPNRIVMGEDISKIGYMKQENITKVKIQNLSFQTDAKGKAEDYKSEFEIYAQEESEWTKSIINSDFLLNLERFSRVFVGSYPPRVSFFDNYLMLVCWSSVDEQINTSPISVYKKIDLVSECKQNIEKISVVLDIIDNVKASLVSESFSPTDNTITDNIT